MLIYILLDGIWLYLASSSIISNLSLDLQQLVCNQGQAGDQVSGASTMQEWQPNL